MTNKADPYVLADEVVIWASALLDLAVLNEALTSRDSAERLQNMDAGEVIRRAFGKLKNIRAQHDRIVGELLCADSLQPAEVYRLVDAKDYDALAAKLAMAEDAAAKGDAARQQCGGMEMEIEELRAEAQALGRIVDKLTQYNESLYEENTRLLADCEKIDREVAALRAKLSDLPGWLRDIYEWGYVGGQNNPNGYIDEEDRDKWVNDILVRNHIST